MRRVLKRYSGRRRRAAHPDFHACAASPAGIPGLIWNQAHLRRILHQYETHHNQHRPHRCLHGAAPLKPLPEPADLDLYRVRRHARVGGLNNEYRLVA